MATVTLNWTNPTVRTDVPPTPLAPSEIASVAVFDSDSATPNIPIANILGAATTFVINNVGPGVHVYTVVVVDTLGNKSAPSNGASTTITIAPPAAVTDLVAVVS
jgi:hypothetical protein